MLNDREAFVMMAAQAEQVAELSQCPETAGLWRKWAADARRAATETEGGPPDGGGLPLYLVSEVA